MAFVIIACNLGYDLENTGEWKLWAQAAEGEVEGDLIAGFDDVTEEDVLEMEDEQMDKYMDWMQNTHIEDDDRLYASTSPRPLSLSSVYFCYMSGIAN